MTAKFVQHRSPQTNKAKAPYNFVPLPETVLTIEGGEKKKVVEGLNDKYHADRHTGHIDLVITTETPLYTRCATPPEVWSKYRGNDYFEDDKPKVTAVRECQDFFHHGDEKKIPVIPGSTLRGMTRALVEILAYGKMNFVTDAKIVHRAVADPSSLGKKYREQMLGRNKDYPRIWLDYPSPNLRGGYLEVINDEWFIRPAVTHQDESLIHVSYESAVDAFGRDVERHTTYPCWVIPRKRRTREKSDKFKLDMATTGQISFAQTEDETDGWRKAKLVVSGFMNNKKMECAIYEPDTNAKLIEIKRGDRLLYQEDMRLSREKKNTPRKLKPSEPIFYLLNDKNELIFFGTTMMFRLPYTNTVHNLIPEKLRRFNEIDLAEAIFGTVELPNKPKNFSGRQLAGRVFFSDAICQTQNPFFDNDKQGRIVPKILSSPKLTSFQLYLVQPEPNHYEPRDAQTGRDDLKAKWYIVSEKSLKKMEEDVPTNIIEKVRKLLGREFAIDDQGKADEKFIHALESAGVTRQELRNYKRNILQHTAHELRTYYDDCQGDFGTVTRGSKRYWHQANHKQNINETDYLANPKLVRFHPEGKGVQERKQRRDGSFENWKESKQHTILRPVKPQTVFKGKVYFENLSDLELGALLTALELSTDESSKRHQIGMAKPYGLGSVKIETQFVLQNREHRYQLLFDVQNDGWSNDVEKPKDIKTKKEQAEITFKNAILELYNNLVTQNSKVSDFWDIPRLQALSTMLEWRNAGNFDEKKYADLENDKSMWRDRYVLPYPQKIGHTNDEYQKNNDPKPIHLIGPNLWTETCSENPVGKIANEDLRIDQPQNVALRQAPKIPLALLNLPDAKVPGELNKFYQEWENVTDETLKLEMGKVIVAKGKTWKKSKEKDWYKKVIEFVERNK